jgi:ribosome-binding factor A
MPSKLRLKRIADRIKQEISEMQVTGRISDPRLSSMFITDVTIDRELTFANIYVSSLEGQESAESILEGLKHASGFLRSNLADKIALRSFPKLRFFWDETPEKAEKIERLLDSLLEDTQDNGK